MNKIKSFLVFILLFSILFCFPISKASAVSTSLRLTSTPAGAAVYLNGRYTYHLTPYTIPGLISGTTYAFRLQKTGYVTKTVSLRAVAGGATQTVALSVTAVPPSLRLTSLPTGATVYVNGVKQASLTPCTFKAAVLWTHYALTFSKAGYVTQMTQITATTTNSNLTVSLKKALVLYVTSSPSGATIYVNNLKQARLTPCTLTGYAYGSVLNLLVSKTGYLPFSQSFSTLREGTSNISAKLLRMPTPIVPVPTITKTYTGVVPALQYAGTTATESRNFAWKYNGTAYTWKVEAPSSLLAFDRSQTAYINTYFKQTTVAAQQSMSSTSSPLLKAMVQECYGTNYGDYVAWTMEPQNIAYMQQLASKLSAAAQTSGYDYFQKAEFILGFVQSIPYKVTPWYHLPALTLFDTGKCVDKTLLYASLLHTLGYNVALFGFPGIDATNPDVGHEAVGVAFTKQQMTSTFVFPASNPLTFHPKAGLNYYFAETTLPGWRLGEPSFLQIPLIYPLN